MTAGPEYPFTGFATARLLVQDWRGQVADARFLADLDEVLRPEVLAPLPPPMQRGPGGVAAWVEARAGEAAVYSVLGRRDGGLLGLLILAHMPGEARVHLGYLFGRAAWGQGYASELVGGLVAALADGAQVEVLGGVARDNPASARVLVKNGFGLRADMSDRETDIYARRVGPGLT